MQRERERERQRHRQREKQAPCREPDVGLDPGTPRSCPGLQAALNRCATRAARGLKFLMTGVVCQPSGLSVAASHMFSVRPIQALHLWLCWGPRPCAGGSEAWPELCCHLLPHYP